MVSVHCKLFEESMQGSLENGQSRCPEARMVREDPPPIEETVLKVSSGKGTEIAK